MPLQVSDGSRAASRRNHRNRSATAVKNRVNKPTVQSGYKNYKHGGKNIPFGRVRLFYFHGLPPQPSKTPGEDIPATSNVWNSIYRQRVGVRVRVPLTLHPRLSCPDKTLCSASCAALSTGSRTDRLSAHRLAGHDRRRQSIKVQDDTWIPVW